MLKIGSLACSIYLPLFTPVYSRCLIVLGFTPEIIGHSHPLGLQLGLSIPPRYNQGRADGEYTRI